MQKTERAGNSGNADVMVWSPLVPPTSSMSVLHKKRFASKFTIRNLVCTIFAIQNLFSTISTICNFLHNPQSCLHNLRNLQYFLHDPRSAIFFSQSTILFPNLILVYMIHDLQYFCKIHNPKSFFPNLILDRNPQSKISFRCTCSQWSTIHLFPISIQIFLQSVDQHDVVDCICVCINLSIVFVKPTWCGRLYLYLYLVDCICICRLYLYLSNQHDVVDCICLFKTNLGFDHLAVAGVPIRIGDPIEFFIRIDAKKSGRQTCIDNLQFSSVLNSNTDYLLATCINHHAHFGVGSVVCLTTFLGKHTTEKFNVEVLSSILTKRRCFAKGANIRFPIYSAESHLDTALFTNLISPVLFFFWHDTSYPGFMDFFLAVFDSFSWSFCRACKLFFIIMVIVLRINDATVKHIGSRWLAC